VPFSDVLTGGASAATVLFIHIRQAAVTIMMQVVNLFDSKNSVSVKIDILR